MNSFSPKKGSCYFVTEFLRKLAFELCFLGSISLYETMSTCESLKSAEFEYINSHDASAVNSIERKIGTSLPSLRACGNNRFLLLTFLTHFIWLLWMGFLLGCFV